MKSQTHRPSPALTMDATYDNSFKNVYPWAQATGLRPYGLRHRAQSSLHEERIAEDFLVNSRIRRFDREFELSLQSFFFDAGAVMSSMVGNDPIVEEVQVPLPKGTPLRMEVGEAIQNRRSIRTFTGEMIHFDDLGTLARSSGGVTARGEIDHFRGGKTIAHLRTTPSAGGLYPIEIYVAALNIRGLKKGIYRYDPLQDSFLQTGDRERLDQLMVTFAGEDETITLSRAGAVFLLVGRPGRATRKYGARGLRHMFIEAGHMAQNIHLASVSLGIGSVDSSSIYEDEAHEVLRMDGIHETLVHTIVVGMPDHR